MSGEGAWRTLPGTGFPPMQTGMTFLVQRECLCVLPRAVTDPTVCLGRAAAMGWLSGHPR